MGRGPDLGTTILRRLDRHFAPDLPATRFARNVLLVSLAGLVPAVALYVATSPGLAAHLLATEGAGSRFLRQILTNGLPVVFTVNFASFLLFARFRSRRMAPGRLVALDLLARVGLFLALHAVIFAASAVAFGSFGGSPGQALRVVAPTLVQAAGFGNLSGAYLYATLLSALPLHVAALAAIRGGRSGTGAAGTGAAVALALVAFALQAAVLTALAALISALQAG
jgi:hypothetical protein